MTMARPLISDGIGLPVTIILVVMKLFGVEPFVTWSWWWVTVLLWAPPALILAIATLFICGFLIGTVIFCLTEMARRK